MSEIDRSVRVRALLSRWFPLIIAACLLVAVAGGAWAYQVHGTANVETEQVSTERWSETTSYEHSSVIVNESLPFNESERVTNRPVYYTSLSEALDVSYRYEYAADDGDIQVNTETRVQYRGIEGETTLWEYSEPLARGTATELTPGRSHTVNATLVIEDVYEAINTVEQQLGTAGTIEIRIVSTSSVTGTIDGESVEHTYESVMPITVTPTTFRVLEIETIDETETQTRTIERTAEPGLVQSGGPVVVTLLSLAALIGLVAARRAGYVRLSADERELLRIHQQEQEFSEWITRGTFPSERDYEQTILVDDLEGLVDVAIDTNKRVIKDEQLGVSTVLDGDYIYVYVRPDSPAEDWLISYADTTMEEFESYDF